MNKGDDYMRKEHCRDCVCLVEGPNGEWMCDEAGVEISEMYHCPENYTPSATNGDYGPGNPWDAPGGSIDMFIRGVYD